MVEVDGAILRDDTVLQEIVARIVKALHPTRIYLFGSQARGDATQDSDYDLMVLVDQPREPLYRLSQEGHRALRGVPAAVDVVVWERAKFDARLHLKASLPSTVVREGKLVHAACPRAHRGCQGLAQPGFSRSPSRGKRDDGGPCRRMRTAPSTRE